MKNLLDHLFKQDRLIIIKQFLNNQFNFLDRNLQFIGEKISNILLIQGAKIIHFLNDQRLYFNYFIAFLTLILIAYFMCRLLLYVLRISGLIGVKNILDSENNDVTLSKLDKFLDLLKDDFRDFKKQVEELAQRESQERKAIQIEMAKLYTISNNMSQETINLTRALRGDFKLQGQWGELVLENVLNSCGLRKGHEYEVQVSFQDRDNPNYSSRPDVIVHLPGGRHVIIDSKVSLSSYYDHVSGNGVENADKTNIKRHLNALYKHISDLSKKHYEKLYQNSLDYVLMFVPLESAFVEAIKYDHEFLDKSIAQKIIVVSPSTLLATLKTIESTWKYYKITENASLVYSKAAVMTDKMLVCLAELDKLGKEINKIQISYENVIKNISIGKGSLLYELRMLESMGVSKLKGMPKRFSALNFDQDEIATDDPAILKREEKRKGFFFL